MKERPILFSTPMVRAILEWGKTQTRRIVKPQPLGAPPKIGCHALDGGRYGFFDEERDFVCRYGAPGDRLWVKETWASTEQTGCHRFDAEIVYRADGQPWAEEFDGWKWRPSIFMPRDYSRVTLEVVNVRVERLQDISEEDAIAEGIERGEDFFQCPTWKDYLPGEGGQAWFPDDPIGSYRSLWESINGPGSWDANPWVWVVEFKQVEKAGDT